MLKKIGTPTKITHVVFGAIVLDPNLIVAEIRKKYKNKSLSLDELHEFLKTLYVIDYSSSDLQHIIELLQSSGIRVIK